MIFIFFLHWLNKSLLFIVLQPQICAPVNITLYVMRKRMHFETKFKKRPSGQNPCQLTNTCLF